MSVVRRIRKLREKPRGRAATLAVTSVLVIAVGTAVGYGLSHSQWTLAALAFFVLVAWLALVAGVIAGESERYWRSIDPRRAPWKYIRGGIILFLLTGLILAVAEGRWVLVPMYLLLAVLLWRGRFGSGHRGE